MIETAAKKALRKATRDLHLVIKNANRLASKGEPIAMVKVVQAANSALESTRPLASPASGQSLPPDGLFQVLEAVLESTAFATSPKAARKERGRRAQEQLAAVLSAVL